MSLNMLILSLGFMFQKCLYSLAASLEACRLRPRDSQRGNPLTRNHSHGEQQTRGQTREDQLSRGLRLLLDNMRNVRSLMSIRDLMADVQQLLSTQYGRPSAVAAELARLAQTVQGRSKSTLDSRAGGTMEIYACMEKGGFQRSRDIYSIYGGPLPKPPSIYLGVDQLPKPPKPPRLANAAARRNRSIDLPPAPSQLLPQPPPTYAAASRYIYSRRRMPSPPPPLILSERLNTTATGGMNFAREEAAANQQGKGSRRWNGTRSSTPTKQLAGDCEPSRYEESFLPSAQ
jgi:hypothetical protein